MSDPKPTMFLRNSGYEASPKRRDVMSGPKFVICLSNSSYEASLERRKLYRLIPDEAAAKHHQVRVVDESGEDYLYPESCFLAAELPEAVAQRMVDMDQG